MTQVSRYGHMLKVTVTGMRMRVNARYRVTGSVLDDTVMGAMLGAETTLEIDSPADPGLVARVVRNAERGCGDPIDIRITAAMAREIERPAIG